MMSDQDNDDFATQFSSPPTACPETVWLSTNAGDSPRPNVALRSDAPSGVSPPEAISGQGTGRYRILGEIARGGMGAVLRGYDSELNRDLAVKVLLERFKDEPEVLRRFFEEAQIGGQLQHPGIVPIYDIGTFADKRPFFAMKLVRGHTLADLLGERSIPSDDLPRFLTIFEQMAQTIAYAHSKGVIHRDLKPANVMVGAFGEVQVMDWGLAKVLSSRPQPVPRPEIMVSMIQTARSLSDTEISMAGSVMGTYAYMPPEQALGEVERVDERADVFGLGSILCEMLTGKPAYVGRFAELRRKAESADLTDAFSRLDLCGADGELIALARSTLAAEPADRPRDASVVARGVAAYLASVQKRLRASELARVEADAQAKAERMRAESKRMRRKFTVALTGFVLVAVLIGGATWLTLRQGYEARMVETDRVVGAALAQAEAYREQARRVGKNDPEAWKHALAAAEKTADLLSGRVARPDLADKVEALHLAVAAEADGVRRRAELVESYRQLLAKLDKARLEGTKVKDGQFDYPLMIAAYVAAFREAGIDLDTWRPEAVGAASLGAESRERVAVALDQWWRHETDPRRVEGLRSLARRIDPDPFRNRLRDALASGDPATLSALARATPSETLPPTSALLLGLALDGRGGGREEAIAFLARAQRRSPGDFWINHHLGFLTDHVLPRRSDDAVRFLTAAVALRPISALSHANLGSALFQAGRADEGIAALREAVRLEPGFAAAHNELGLMFDAVGRLDEAVACFRESLRLGPDSAAWNLNLGGSLRDQGKYREALISLRRGHELGSKQANWSLPSARWIERCEQLAELDLRLPAVLKGDIRPAGTELLGLARICRDKGLYAASAHFYELGMAAQPERVEKIEDTIRYLAARAASRAGQGEGLDDPKPDGAARSRLRSQAREWLRLELGALSHALEAANPEGRDMISDLLNDWKVDSRIDCVRNATALAKLPEVERKEWRILWADVDALLARAKTAK